MADQSTLSIRPLPAGPTGTAMQLVLFEVDEGVGGKKHITNAVGLYDLAPKYVFFAPDDSRANGMKKREGAAAPVADAGDRRFLPSLRREFEFSGKPYTLTVVPARVERRAKDRDQVRIEEVDAYPGEREQIVEEVIRRLATDRSRLTVNEKQHVMMRFTLYEILQELRRVNHTLSLSELKQALIILRRATIRIERKGRGKPMLESAAFPVLAMRNRDLSPDAGIHDDDDDDEGDADTYLQFNPLVEEAIRRTEFHRVDYEWLMRMPNPFSRWLYKRVALTLQDATDTSFMTISASEIARDSGMTMWSRWRDMLKWITETVEALVQVGALSEVERDVIRDGRKYVDIHYRLIPSELFVAQIRSARRAIEHGSAEIRRVTGQDGPLDDFVPIDEGTAAITRRRLRTALTAPAAGK